MTGYDDLRLKPLAIGSLPHDNVEDAMQLVEKYFNEIPFLPQLKNVSKNEDMIVQLLEGMPSFSSENVSNFNIDPESEEFLYDLEQFFSDYEDIVINKNYDLLEKYAITNEFSHSFTNFENIIRNTKPKYAKAQISGPFTFTTSINVINGRCIIYDETLRDISVKLLSLKVLWMIKRIKSANNSTCPIIFMDEPSVSQIGTSAYMSIQADEFIDMLKEISEIIKINGGISAVHCCGKCNWTIPIRAGVNFINFDAYSFFENFSIYHSEIRKFLNDGGKIVWGIVPTSDNNLEETADNLEKLFEKCVNNLTKKGIDETLIINNSLITSSCGAGSLSVEKAENTMKLIYELSNKLRLRY